MSAGPADARSRFPWGTALIVAAALVASALPPVGEALAYRRSAVLEGQVWRILTGHLVHGTPGLAATDLSVLLVLGACLELHSPALFRRALLFGFLVAGLGLVVMKPGLERYEGSSAGGAAVLVALALTLLFTPGPRWTRVAAALLLGGLAVRCALELSGVLDAPLLGDGTRHVEPLAHLLGGAAGALAFVVTKRAARGEHRAPPG